MEFLCLSYSPQGDREYVVKHIDHLDVRIKKKTERRKFKNEVF